jgi:CRP/FNR family transcriptional regulator, cyclic AMP receptor protein
VQAGTVTTLAAIFDSDEASLAAAAACFRLRSFARGDVLFDQGELCTRCWIVVEGALALASYGREGQLAQVATYGPGEFVGAFPDPAEHPGELSAQLPTTAIEIASAELLALAGRENAVARGIAILLARQHRNLIDRLANRMILSAAGRVYAELLRLADGEGRIAPPPVVTALSLRVHTARETASRAIATAERRGLIARDENGWTIPSPARLKGVVV